MSKPQSRLDKTRDELLLNIVAASSTTALCVAALNPFDVLRIAWQTKPSTDVRTLPRFAADIATQNGRGFFYNLYRPAIGVNAVSVAFSSGTRLGLYPVTKETLARLMRRDEHQDAQTSLMFLAGFLSGALGFFISTPFFAAKIQAQTFGSTKSGWSCFVDTVRGGRPFSGASILVARGALFSAGFSAGYDGTKARYRSTGRKEGPLLHATASVIAAFAATAIAAPFDAMLTRYQSSRVLGRNPNNLITSPLSCAVVMFREGGPRIFFKGWSLFFSRVAPLFIVQLPLYEQTRRMLGMDFMR